MGEGEVGFESKKQGTINDLTPFPLDYHLNSLCIFIFLEKFYWSSVNCKKNIFIFHSGTELCLEICIEVLWYWAVADPKM